MVGPGEGVGVGDCAIIKLAVSTVEAKTATDKISSVLLLKIDFILNPP